MEVRLTDNNCTISCTTPTGVDVDANTIANILSQEREVARTRRVPSEADEYAMINLGGSVIQTHDYYVSPLWSRKIRRAYSQIQTLLTLCVFPVQIRTEAQHGIAFISIGEPGGSHDEETVLRYLDRVRHQLILNFNRDVPLSGDER